MGESRPKIAISGATGLLGRALEVRLRTQKYAAERLVRRRDFDGIYWDPVGRAIDGHRLAGMRAVVHLAGANIGEGRWTDARRAEIRNSRIQGTRLVAETLAELESKPEVFVSASAVGYYGDTGARRVDETASVGNGFLAGVCRQWEQACAPAKSAGIRVVNLRFGMLLSEKGGALKKMLPPFRAGVGGRFGDGEQYMSWIMLEDAVSACIHVIENESIEGPVNVTAPDEVTNADFAKSLGAALRRPALVPTPAFALRLAVGRQMADELLLSGQRVKPRVLEESGFTYRYPHLESGLAAIADRL